MSVSVSSFAAFDSAIQSADQASSGTYTITLTGSITESSDLLAINLHQGVSLDILGNGNTLSGQNSFAGLFVYQGTVSIDNLTISDAIAEGGNGGNGEDGGGGGGAGLGGGLFVAGTTGGAGNGGNVFLTGVNFLNDSAIGGAGGTTTTKGGGGGGGGGLLTGDGGNGGSTSGANNHTGGGGGGGGIGSDGGSGATSSTNGSGGQIGIVQGAAGGGAGAFVTSGSPAPGAGAGSAGGGGGGGANTSGSGGGGGGGGGGVSGKTGTLDVNPVVVFDSRGAAGGYGGGGGGGASGSDAVAGGNGGFGGGGGGGNTSFSSPIGGFGGGGGGSTSGIGGFGGGNGNSAGGGGGLGAGGDIFVQQGGHLTIESATVFNGTVAGGSGVSRFSGGSGAGSSFGAAIFLQGDQSQTLSAITGGTISILGAIADQNGSKSGYSSDKAALVLNGPGVIIFDAASTYTGGTSLDDGTLDLDAPGALGTGTLSFSGEMNQTLAFATADAPTVKIAGFTTQNFIDITDLSIGSKTTLHVNSGGTLALVDSLAASGTLDLVFKGATTAENFVLSSDGAGGADLDVACFCPGTRITTASGKKVVQDLLIGDVVKTLRGDLRRIKWIGKRGYAAPFCNHPKVLPVRIAKDALSKNVPARDLWVSPGHALCVDDQLIHASRLVNGRSIIQADSVDEVIYYHIELDSHDVIFAENCPTETFRGEHFRRQFANFEEFAMLYPESVEQTARLPYLTHGFGLQAIQDRINVRAGLVTPEPAGALRGYVDQVNATIVSGWAQCVETPDIPVCLDIYVADERIGQVLANIFRDDVVKAGFGKGYHGFEYHLVAGLVGEITVSHAPTNSLLSLASPAKAA